MFGKKTKHAEPKQPVVRVPSAGLRGFLGPGRGEANYVHAPAEFRGTTRQVCGLYPFAVEGSPSAIGVPIGRTGQNNAATAHCDPISWFQRAKLIHNPSMFVLGKPGLGKSTIVRRIATGLSAYGTIPLVLGDLKPDYVDLIEALGGQVISLGRGRGYLNVLDPGEASSAAELLRSKGFKDEAKQVLADAHGRRHTMVSALITIARQAAPTDREETIIDRALKHLDETFDGVPVLGDLLKVVQNPPAEVRAVALDRGNLDRYKEITEHLEASLIGLCGGGRLGETFSQHTTNPMLRDRPVVYDVSAIDDSDSDLQAATLLACWSAGFGTVNVANALADAGLEPRRHYFVILDELWRALRSGTGMVDRVDALTRLNRQRGVGMAMISHTMSDMQSLASETDRLKAKGFLERSGLIVCGGLPTAEMPQLNSVVNLSRKEQEMLASWQDPPEWDPVAGRETEPPGRGKFLLKVGGKTGVAIKVELTQVELSISDTNKRWHEQSRTGDRTETTPESVSV